MTEPTHDSNFLQAKIPRYFYTVNTGTIYTREPNDLPTDYRNTKVEANHLANKYTREYKTKMEDTNYEYV